MPPLGEPRLANQSQLISPTINFETLGKPSSCTPLHTSPCHHLRSFELDYIRFETMANQDSWPNKRQKLNGGSNTHDKSKYANGKKNRGAGISASGLISGDVGIFVTCDKGKEKTALREMADILTSEMGLDGEDKDEPNEQNGQSTAQEANADGNGDTARLGQSKKDSGGIEDEIQRELAELAQQDIVDVSKKRKLTAVADKIFDSLTAEQDSSNKKPRLELVTLDIPCVTFIRFLSPSNSPSGKAYDPVSIVMKICKDAKANPHHQRSRFVKRLTPLSKVRKVMSGGVEELCGEILPPVFGARDDVKEGGEDTRQGYKYAIRVTVRNNDKVKKDDIIKTVAEEVRRLGLIDGGEGDSRHRVDLKRYDKLVLVEVYRNVVGMAVVDGEWDRGLRRFNLAEIYADGRKEEEAATGAQSTAEAPETT
jgi:tRNA acetyltransferase TAN1